LHSQLSDTSIILDASEYIKELKQKVVRLKQEMAFEEAAGALKQKSPSPTVLHVYIHSRQRSQFCIIGALVDINHDHHHHHPASIVRSMQVTVETTLGHGFLVNVFSDKSCPGLLVSVLEAFDELGLSVLEATASCADTFRLEAVGGEVVIMRKIPIMSDPFVNPAMLPVLMFTCFWLESDAEPGGECGRACRETSRAPGHQELLGKRSPPRGLASARRCRIHHHRPCM
jgi:hypothetical protein